METSGGAAHGDRVTDTLTRSLQGSWTGSTRRVERGGAVGPGDAAVLGAHQVPAPLPRGEGAGERRFRVARGGQVVTCAERPGRIAARVQEREQAARDVVRDARCARRCDGAPVEVDAP